MEEYLEAERRRKLLLETELRCAALAKRRKAEQERIFEEEWNKSMEERRAQARRKWHQGSAERSRWRAQRAKEMENSTHVKLETRQKLWEERKSRPLPAAKSHHSVILGCWVSTQSQLTTVWKRRFCRLNADGLRLYASAVSEMAEVFLVHRSILCLPISRIIQPKLITSPFSRSSQFLMAQTLKNFNYYQTLSP